MMSLRASFLGILLIFYLTCHARAVLSPQEESLQLGYDLLFSSVEELANNTYLYQIKVKVTDGFDKTCKFKGRSRGILTQNITNDGDMVLGRMLAFGQEQPSFFCKSPDLHLTSTFEFRKLNLTTNRKTLFHVYDRKDCSISIPLHFTTEYLRIMVMKLSCLNFKLNTNNFKVTANGFLFENGSITLLPYDFFVIKPEVNSDGEMKLLITSKRSMASSDSALIDFSLTFSDFYHNSPIQSLKIKYYYPKSIDGNYYALAPETLGILGEKLSYQYVLRNETAHVSCFVGGYPYFLSSILKDGTPLRGVEERTVGLYGYYMRILGYTLPYVNESTMGNYTCVIGNGQQILHSSTILAICKEPTVKFAIEENENQIKAVFETEYVSPMMCETTDKWHNPAPIPIIKDPNGKVLVTFNTTGSFQAGRMEITWKDEAKYSVPRVVICSIGNMCTDSKDLAFPVTKI